MNLLTKKKQIHNLENETYGCRWEGRGEGIVKAFLMDMCILL